jgi:mannose-6-phosphate isomerase
LRSIVRLEGAIQRYDWGSRTALAALRGRPVPSAEPEAELWLGAHANGEAHVVAEDGARVPLSAWIARDPAAVLGDAGVSRFGPRLPFLFKLLAVDAPLSLQAHPDAEQARAGFARERHLDPAERIYADAEAKPELVVAHTAFRVLAGLRPIAAIRSSLARVGLGEDVAGEGEAWLRAFLARWLSHGRDDARDAALGRALERAGRDDPIEARMLALAERHPGDPGVVAPLLLHEMLLAPGEALFLEAGELHCYLEGVAAEIMASSDNVLRAGLTTKRRAVGELLRIGRFAQREPALLRAAPVAPGVATYDTPADCFALSTVEVGSAGVAIAERSGVEIVLCHAGRVAIAEGAGGPALALGPGESGLVPAAAGPYRLTGAGRLYRATVPPIGVAAEPGR